MAKTPLQFQKKPFDNHDTRGKSNVQPDSKVGAAQVFARPALPQRPVAPEAMGPDKDAALKQKKMGAAEVFGRRR